MASAPVDLPTRMSRWRRRIAGAGVGIFAGAWLAVLGLGQHGHAAASSGSATPPQSALPAPTAQDPYSDGSGYSDDGSGSDGGSQDPYAGQGSQGSQTQQSQAPLVTRQS